MNSPTLNPHNSNKIATNNNSNGRMPRSRAQTYHYGSQSQPAGMDYPANYSNFNPQLYSPYPQYHSNRYAFHTMNSPGSPHIMSAPGSPMSIGMENASSPLSETAPHHHHQSTTSGPAYGVSHMPATTDRSNSALRHQQYPESCNPPPQHLQPAYHPISSPTPQQSHASHHHQTQAHHPAHLAYHAQPPNMRRPGLSSHRQRSTSEHIMKPQNLLVDTNHHHHSALSYGMLVSPLSTPTEHYESQMSLTTGSMLMNNNDSSQGGSMSMGSHMGASSMHSYHHSGFLNPAHLSQPAALSSSSSLSRRRAPSAPLGPPHMGSPYYQTPLTFPQRIGQPWNGIPSSSALNAVPTPTSCSPDPGDLSEHGSTVPMNPVDEEFKRRILQLKFEEREIAIDYLKEQAKKTGFSVLVRTSRPDYVVIICNCGRRVKQVEGERKRKRKRKTAMTGCEWHVILFRRTIPGSAAPRLWEYRASSKMEHNHALDLGKPQQDQIQLPPHQQQPQQHHHHHHHHESQSEQQSTQSQHDQHEQHDFKHDLKEETLRESLSPPRIQQPLDYKHERGAPQ
ncbi:hypothetical protein DFS34DRAFT_597047 [Phlyctochytrium arcticum]|nr:hypothetical protein DFS34DRAFT_597047 [Phlyctochytrium arcticum]